MNNVCSNPLISIILPTFNRAELLVKSIQSVINQTYQKWELIIWNDGSTDKTARTVNNFHDKRIRYFFEENHGRSYALNNSIQKSNGKYIAFIDDDDQWVSWKLEYQLDILRKFDFISVLFGNYCNHDLLTGLIVDGFNYTKEGLDYLHTKNIGDNIFFVNDGLPGAIFISNFIAFDTVILKKEIFSTNLDISFNEELRNSADPELWMRICLKNYKFAFTDKIVLDRIKYESSLSRPSTAMYLNKIQSLDYCKNIAIQHHRADLVKIMRRPYLNAWQNLIYQYGKNGEVYHAFFAFINSLKYGLSLGSFRLLYNVVKNKLFS
jgi:glycosyltransferase involved in cell wall biosynthesis